MRDRIDPVCSATHYTTSRLYEVRYDIFEDLFAIARVASGSDDPEHPTLCMQIPADIEEIWCLFDRAESLWIYI
jgi:hypothetical protein